MKVDLQINNDKELRDAIKDMIRGQVLGVTRTEISKIITGEVQRKMESITIPKYTIERAIAIAASKQVQNWQKSTEAELIKQITPTIISETKEYARKIVDIDLRRTMSEYMVDKIAEIPMKIAIDLANEG